MAERTGSAAKSNKAITISRRAADCVRAGQPWIYRSEVAGGSGAEPGELVTVADGRGAPLGSGLWSSASEIAVRMVSRRAGLERQGYLEELRERLSAAVRLRREVAGEAFADGSGTDACRLAFSDADGVSGIVIDRYGSTAVAQLLVQGTARADVRGVVREVLASEPWAELVVERPEPRIRELEGLGEVEALDTPVREVLWARSGSEEVSAAEFEMNGLRFGFERSGGQKTGAFLDQRLNYEAAAEWAKRLGRTGRALDVCTYHGGFALHLGRVCKVVTGVDASRAALESADANLERNAGRIAAEVDWVEADAFELLADWQRARERFDSIVLDPPALAKTKRAAEGALRGYKELNLRAMKMLGHTGSGAGSEDNAGLLVTCSCSYHVSVADFVEMLRAAAIDASRRVQVLEVRGAAPDHPAVVTIPESSYLKCVVCRLS